MSKQRKTKEPQYQFCVEYAQDRGLETLGLMTSQTWYDDPRRLVFTLSRYKFVAKMLEGAGSVLEVGCGDGFGTRIVRQAVGAVTAIDFDPVFIDDARSRTCDKWPVDFQVHDMLEGPTEIPYDAAYSLDVLEHISPEDEDRFLNNVACSLRPDANCIFGIPSLESQPHASPQSRVGHVNCKSMPDFKDVMLRHFSSVCMFSMNDEVVHTGFHKMANYLFAIGFGPKGR